MIYSVYTTDNFEKEVAKLSKEEQRRVKNTFLQLKENPYIGDFLQIKILREKRLEEKRIYYLVFDDLNAVLIVALSDKKTQQKTVDFIRNNLNEYKELLKRLLKSKLI